MSRADLAYDPVEPDPFEWTEFALCKDKTHLFFGPPGERPSKRRKREALAVSYCNVCPVMGVCREMGRRNNESGIWGGENEEARARAGHPPRGSVRRSIAAAAREARTEQADEAAWLALLEADDFAELMSLADLDRADGSDEQEPDDEAINHLSLPPIAVL